VLANNVFGRCCTKYWLAVLFVTEDDIQQWKESDHPEELAFLMSAAKRQDQRSVCLSFQALNVPNSGLPRMPKLPIG